MTNFDFMRQRLESRAGLLPLPPKPAPGRSIADLQKSEWSPEFERLMRNRLVMGALRYGPLHAPGKRKYDRSIGMRKRLIQYIDTGNTEFLVDIANLALLEFEEGTHPNKHWAPAEGDHACVPNTH